MEPISSDTQAHADLLFNGRLSLKGQRWRMTPVPDRLAERAALLANVPAEVGRLLIARGIMPDDAASFLAPKLAENLPDPSVLKDMDKAASRIKKALEDGEKIAIFGDYDVDGATSAAILIEALRAYGADVIFYVPDRMKEGYGPNAGAMQVLHDQGAKLLITLDCGTLSFVALERAASLGLETIVVDHHKADPNLPIAHAIINPNRLDEEVEVTKTLGHLAAVGVTFLLIVALNRLMRMAGHESLNLFSYLDRVALGTVCDVVSLTGLNRAYVSQGLKVLAERHHPGLRALSAVARLDEKPTAYHLGFLLGPRINAGGRVGKSFLGTELLTATDEEAAGFLARELDRYNEDRRAIEANVLDDALLQATALEARGAMPPVLCLKGEGWHAGVIGIVASRLKERFGRPTIICADEGSEIKGSGRSIAGVDLGSAVLDAGHHGLTLKGGGHAMAAGMSLSPDRFEDFTSFLNDRLASQIAQARAGRILSMDMALSLSGATVPLVQSLDKLAPFGMGNPGPRVLLQDVTIRDTAVVGKNHLRLMLGQGDGKTMKAMAFRAVDEEWGQALMRDTGQRYHFAVKLKLDFWTGSPKVDITLDDALPLA